MTNINLFKRNTYLSPDSEIYRLQEKNSVIWSPAYEAWIVLDYFNVKKILEDYKNFSVSEGYQLDTFNRAKSDRSIGLKEGRPNYPNNINSKKETYSFVKQVITDNLDNWIIKNLNNMFENILDKDISLENDLIYPFIVQSNIFPIDIDKEIELEIINIISNHSKSFLMKDKQECYINLYNLIKKLNLNNTKFNKKFYIDLYFSGSGATCSLIKQCFINFDYLTKDNIDNYIEECIRTASRSSIVYRTAVSECLIGNCKINNGDRVILHLGAANFDKKRFGENAFEFCTERTFDKVNLAFGHGPQKCVGYQHTKLLVKQLLLFLLKNNINFDLTQITYLDNFNNRLYDIDDISLRFYKL